MAETEIVRMCESLVVSEEITHHRLGDLHCKAGMA